MNKNLKHKIKRFLEKFCYKKSKQDIEVMTEEILKIKEQNNGNKGTED